MDTQPLTQTDSVAPSTAPPAAVARCSASRMLPAAMVIGMLLVISAGIRYQMEAAVASRIDATRFSPFPLQEIPIDIGPWKGKDEQLDPFIARKTGSTDYIMRRYTNSQTGAILEVLMLYGPAAEMGYHKPDACYPGAGYKLVGGGDLRSIRFDLDQSEHAVNFRNLVFQRGEGGLADRQQVYYVWRYSDTYALDLGQPSVFGRLPGMFKIQVARPLAASESSDGRASAANPCEEFLARLMVVFEEKLVQPISAEVPSSTAVAASSPL